jgi:hypothetical protein
VSGKSDLKRGCDGRRHRCVPADVASCALVLHLIEEVRFSFDSPRDSNSPSHPERERSEERHMGPRTAPGFGSRQVLENQPQASVASPNAAITHPRSSSTIMMIGMVIACSRGNRGTVTLGQRQSRDWNILKSDA